MRENTDLFFYNQLVIPYELLNEILPINITKLTKKLNLAKNI